MVAAFLTSFVVRKTGSLLIHVGSSLLPRKVEPQDGYTGTVTPGDGVAINTVDLDDDITALIDELEPDEADGGCADGEQWAQGLVLVEKEVSGAPGYRSRGRTDSSRSRGSSVSLPSRRGSDVRDAVDSPAVSPSSSLAAADPCLRGTRQSELRVAQRQVSLRQTMARTRSGERWSGTMM